MVVLRVHETNQKGHECTVPVTVAVFHGEVDGVAPSDVSASPGGAAFTSSL